MTSAVSWWVGGREGCCAACGMTVLLFMHLWLVQRLGIKISNSICEWVWSFNVHYECEVMCQVFCMIHIIINDKIKQVFIYKISLLHCKLYTVTWDWDRHQSHSYLYLFDLIMYSYDDIRTMVEEIFYPLLPMHFGALQHNTRNKRLLTCLIHLSEDIFLRKKTSHMINDNLISSIKLMILIQLIECWI